MRQNGRWNISLARGGFKSHKSLTLKLLQGLSEPYCLGGSRIPVSSEVRFSHQNHNANNSTVLKKHTLPVRWGWSDWAKNMVDFKTAPRTLSTLGSLTAQRWECWNSVLEVMGSSSLCRSNCLIWIVNLSRASTSQYSERFTKICTKATQN